MRVNGIIAEYNPFHNGHKYHIESSRLRTGADFTIVAMSGSFVQRGAPALVHKYARAEMALQNGADLVLEIPSFYACGSAEYFAHGAVTMLDKLGVVDYLCFGSECGQIDILTKIGEILAKEPESFRKRLNTNLEQGHSFPTARSFALMEECPSLNDALEVFTSPNNILGIEYIKSLLRRESSIKPVTIKRAGSEYHEKRLCENHASALALRQSVFSGQKLSSLKAHMPDSAYHILEKAFSKLLPMQTKDFSRLLLYKLISEEEQGYGQYLDVNSDLSDKIRKNLYQYTDFDNFCDRLKSKNITYSRLSRCMMHILLNITSEEMARYQALDYVPYARVLGIRKDASPLLSAIKQHSTIPMISKLADAHKFLDEPSRKMLEKDIQISHIYNAVEASKSKSAVRNEYSTPIIVFH